MFFTARPVFPAGKGQEQNYQLLLRGSLPSLRGCCLRIAAAAFYRVRVNGAFAGFGPGRTAKGYARVDVVELSPFHRDGGNTIEIEIAGYACRATSWCRQPSFVCAEIRRGNAVLLATDVAQQGFAAYQNIQRYQNAERYSYQRHFNEIWDLRQPVTEKNRVELEQVTAPAYLPGAPIPGSGIEETSKYASRGRFWFDDSLPYRENLYSGSRTVADFQRQDWGVFSDDQVPLRPCMWIQRQKMMVSDSGGTLPVTLSEGEYALLDLGKVWAGFLRLELESEEETDVVLGFSELCEGDIFEVFPSSCQNVLEYLLPAGIHDVESFEPYSARYMVVMAKKGKLRLSSLGVRKWEFDRTKILPRQLKDPQLQAIYDAAVRTFVHNAVDLYMDCPSRERAGWLCDSYFTGKVEHFLTGKTAVEDAFLENFRLYKNKSGVLPYGMLPSSYPGEERGDIYIPQWALWYILEVYEYLTERNPGADRVLFQKSVAGVLNFFAPYENTDGLLEKLPGFNFVEWSQANEWVQDVSFPTNFLYAEALSRAGELYDNGAWIKKAERIRSAAAQMSFNGTQFVDNAIRCEDGALRCTRNASEAGQYYAFLFGDLNLREKRYEQFVERISQGFAGAKNLVAVDCLPGIYLKLMTLIRLKKWTLLGETLKMFFGEMVALTDTLWEYRPDRRKGSCDHGFASFAAVAAYLADGQGDLDI